MLRPPAASDGGDELVVPRKGVETAVLAKLQLGTSKAADVLVTSEISAKHKCIDRSAVTDCIQRDLAHQRQFQTSKLCKERAPHDVAATGAARGGTGDRAIAAARLRLCVSARPAALWLRSSATQKSPIGPC
eukprot:4797947-Pleurochrysis_carterae.AAC.3